MKKISTVILTTLLLGEVAQADIITADKAFADGAYLAARQAYLVEAENGNNHAMFQIAEMYWNGLGMQANTERALNWYNRAAEAGHMEAAYQTASMFMNGDVVMTNYREAARLYELALEGGVLKAGLPLGRIYTTNATGNVDMPKAVTALEKAALDPEGGDHARDAAYFLSQILIAENPGIAIDEAAALRWRMIAAEQGHTVASGDVGLRYYNGDGVEKNPDKALKFITVAAESGDAAAQFNLGLFHYQGVGTEVDYAKALTWFIVAANTDPATDNGTIDQFKTALPAGQVAAAEAEAQKIIDAQ